MTDPTPQEPVSETRPSMPKYRKRPLVIEAIQFTGQNSKEIGQWIGYPCADVEGAGSKLLNIYLVIKTLEGHMRADVGDWIIRGIAGEFYPCKNEIFQKTYESAEAK